MRDTPEWWEQQQKEKREQTRQARQIAFGCAGCLGGVVILILLLVALSSIADACNNGADDPNRNVVPVESRPARDLNREACLALVRASSSADTSWMDDLDPLVAQIALDIVYDYGIEGSREFCESWLNR